VLPDFNPETAHIRANDWKVAPIPADFRNRRTEITGPVDRKMVINALNSGAQVFMADFEDANAPLWDNIVQGQINLRDAIRRTISFTAKDGTVYRLNDQTAVLAVRVRGWHLDEKHVTYNGKPVSGGIFDLGLYLFHNAKELLKRGSGPYVYLPKLQSHLEARLWNEIFVYAQDKLGIPQGSIRATVLIEHILAVFEMHEILYELRDHSSGLNHGRWDYIYSFIKAFNHRDDFVLPDRAQVTMAVHFLRSAAELLVATCHRRGAHAMGGMSAIIPRKDDVNANTRSMQRLAVDKQREADQGFDGAWVAHPGLVKSVHEIFKKAFSSENQITYVPQVNITAADLLTIPIGDITEQGLRNNINVALQYIEAWFGGRGAVAINYLMEDVATAEISRSQIWQWVHHGAKLDDGRPVDAYLYKMTRTEEVQKLQERLGGPRLDQAVALLDELVLNPEFTEFLTVPGYNQMA
jgi:malate synthase